MFDMYDAPEFIHKAMSFLMEGRLSWLHEVESQGLLSLNNENDYVGSDSFAIKDQSSKSSILLL